MTRPTSELVPSLVQGISQQDPYSRALGAAEDQENCINDLLHGARPRNGGRILASGSETFNTPWKYRIERSKDEDYGVLIEDGEITIWNTADGTKCSVTVDPVVTASNYLTNTGESRKVFSAVTLKDTTYIANSQATCAMAADQSDPRGNFGIAHFKAAGYSTNYKLTVTIGGSSWTASYTTPDNSTSANATFIATNRLAAEFGQALATALPAAFTVYWEGSSILIEHDTDEFELASEDGLGGDQLKCFTDKVKKTTDLPQTAWNGYIVAVGGDPEEVQATDYYIEYEGDGDTGAWVEVAKWNTPTTLDPDTMPILLVNTALNTFTVEQATWGKRLAGDGVDSSKDPSFVASAVVDMKDIQGRVCLIFKDGYVLSRSKNGFSYFPDTAQTTLDTDPIDAENASGSVAEITSSVIAGEQIQLWANKEQVRIDAGDQRLTEEFVANRPTTHYEYDGETPPVSGGQSSVFFGTGREDFVWFIEVLYRGNVPRGEIEFNAQCSELIPGRLRHLALGSSAKMLFALSTDELATAYLYQWHNQGNDRVQSAWNKWVWPEVTSVIALWVRQTTVTALFKWPNGSYTLEAIPFGRRMDDSSLVSIRLDHMVDETYGTYGAQNAEGLWPCLLTLPYDVAEEDRSEWVATGSRTMGDEVRGVPLGVEWVSSNEVRVLARAAGQELYFGRVPTAIHEPTELYITRDGTTLPSDRLQINRAIIQHRDSATYKVEVGGTVEVFTAPRDGFKNNEIAQDSGKFDVTVGLLASEAKLRLINDTHLPCGWSAIKHIVEVTSEEQ